MFELERVIQDWRSGLLQNQNVLESDADELESHVRDEVDSLMLAGLSAEEAFMVSTHRIGDPETVGQEFAKVNPRVAWCRRIFWMLFGIFIAILINTIAQISSGLSAVLLVRADVNNILAVVITSVVYMGTFIGVLLLIIVGFDAINQVYKRMFTTSMFLAAGVVGLMLLKGCAITLNVLNVRLLPMEQMSQAVIASKLAGFVWSVFWPIALVVLLFILWPSKQRKTT
jgi:hypothetical protein